MLNDQVCFRDAQYHHIHVDSIPSFCCRYCRALPWEAIGVRMKLGQFTPFASPVEMTLQAYTIFSQYVQCPTLRGFVRPDGQELHGK